MIIVALLLLLVAVIGFGGYTLSKFVSEKSQPGTAQVAKWGFNLEADATKLFGEDYKFDTAENNSIVAAADAEGLTVSASTATNANLVAPGTTGSMTFKVTGTSEVKAALSFSFEDVDNMKDIVLNYTEGEDTTVKNYRPVVWTFKKGDELIATGTLAEIAAALGNEDNKLVIEANENVESIVYTLSWSWAFEDATNADSDALDTLLGMYANDKNVTANGDFAVAADTSTEISFTLKMSVVQLAK